MPRNSQIAGTCDSRFTPWSPSAMLKTRSGFAARSRSGNSGDASRRMTSPYAASALAMASIVCGGIPFGVEIIGRGRGAVGGISRRRLQ